MRTALICTADPDPFIDLDDAKQQLRITDSASDDLINSLIAVACASLEGGDGLLKRAIATQSWQLVLPHFLPHDYRGLVHQRHNLAKPWNAVELPLPPLQSVTTVSYLDPSAQSQTLGSDQYSLIECGTEPSFLIPASIWPATLSRPDAVKITFAAGYEDDKIPRPIWNAGIVIIKQLFELGAKNVFVTGETVFGVSSKTYGVSAAAAQICQDAVDRLLFNYRILGR